MAERGPSPAPQPGDYQPLSESTRRLRQKLLSQDLPGLPPEFLSYLKGQMELDPPGFQASDLSGLPNAVNDLLPWMIDVDPFMTPITQTNFSTLSLGVSGIVEFAHNARKESTGAVDALIGWDVMVPAGTWTFELMHCKGADRGIYTVTLSTTGSLGTIDGYAAATTGNVLDTITGVVVAEPGKQRLTVSMASKNASSSNYKGSIQAVQLRRTA